MRRTFFKLGTNKFKENIMDDNLFNRLKADSAALRKRALETSQSGQERDIALLMQGLATALDAIGALAATTGRLDGPPGLGKSGD